MNIQELLKGKIPDNQILEIEKHLDYAKQINNSSSLYNFDFAIQTIENLCKILIEPETIISAIYYPFLKRDNITIEQVKEKTNNAVIDILNTIFKIENLKINTKEATNDAVRQMFLALSTDLRVIILKLGIELTKIKNLDKYTQADKDELMKIANAIYAPLAGTIGLGYYKNEIENELFKYYKPDVYNKLADELKLYMEDRKKQIETTVNRIKGEAEKSGVRAVVYGRHKEIYSIYKKMVWKEKSLNQIYDILAVRVLVDTIEDCYTMLGKIHSIYTPIENFKDYIAQPKENGYQSLHTTVIVENGDPLEVQIRTHDMHEYAEYGFASHVAYKEHRKANENDQKLNYIRSIMEVAKNSSGEDLVYILKNDVYSDKIFAQTPMGKVLQFPEGANPIDFAYQIHSKIGDTCVGAKINGKLVPLTTPLQNGDVVEIITNPNSKGPSRDWIKFAKMASTRQKINAFFKKAMKTENIEKGKAILESYAKTKGITLSKILVKDYIDEILEQLNFQSLDDMYASVGYGGITAASIIYKLTDLERKKEAKTETPIIITKKIKNTSDNKVSVLGFTNLLTKFAQCCNPLPGDEIVGYISRGKGATIHRADCKSLNSCDSERIVECSWNVEHGKDTFIGSVTIICSNTPSALATISKRISDMKINISSMYAKPINELQSKITFLLIVKNKEELDEVIKRLQPLSIVEEVSRT